MRSLLIIFFFAISFTTPLLSHPFTKDLMEDGHSVHLTKDSDETQDWKIRLIQEAKLSLEISTGFCLGTVFEDLLSAVHTKLIENREIKIDLLLFQAMDFIKEEHFQFLDSLQSEYSDQFSYYTSEASGLIRQGDKAYVTENHTKLMIVDEKYVLLGGTNLVDQLSTTDVNKYPRPDAMGSEFLPGASSDMDTVIRGPVAKKLRKEYFQMVALFKSGESLDDDAGEFQGRETGYYSIPETGQAEIDSFENNPETVHGVKVFGILTGPRMQLHTIGNIYVDLFQDAFSSIHIGNMYLFPRECIFNALINAINRDVLVTLVTNGVHEESSLSNSTKSTYGHLNRLNYLTLMSGQSYRYWDLFTAKAATQKNVGIYELNLKNVLYHKKVMTVDDRYTVVGSYNLGMKSEDADYEVAVVIDSPETSMQMQKILMKDQMNSNNIQYNRALGWYFNPYYNVAQSIEKKILDGSFL